MFHFKRAVLRLSVLGLMTLSEANAQNLDTALTDYAQKVANEIKDANRKKVSVLDFADLQGNVLPLGRFLADEISVDLVQQAKGGFAVVDRANLKTILAEHKLTLEGLIDPENAKKLGQFSGVDAIILGTVTVFEDEVAVSTRVLATDTAEIVGATKTRLPRNKELKSLEGTVSTITPNTAGGNAVAAKPKPKSTFHTFGDLDIECESAQIIEGQFVTTKILVTLVFENKSKDNELQVALKRSGSMLSGKLVESGNSALSAIADEVTGIQAAYPHIPEWTSIPAESSIKATITYRFEERGTLPRRPFRLQQEIMIASPSEGREPRFTVHNLFLGIEK